MKKLLIVTMILVSVLMIAGCTTGEGHEHGLIYVEGIPATCTETGTYDYWYCDDCNIIFADEMGIEVYIKDGNMANTMIEPMKPHDYANDNDCTTGDKCKNCDAVKPAGHVGHVAKTDDGDCSTAITCAHEDCKVVVVEAKEHVGGVATCSEKARCVTCGKPYGAFDSDAHNFSNVVYVWSEDLTTCTIGGACGDCEKAVYETVSTTYARGHAYADFSEPAVPTQDYALNSYGGKCLDEMKSAIVYMFNHGENDIEVMFPALEGNSGPAYEMLRSAAAWALDGFETPEEVIMAWNLYLSLQEGFDEFYGAVNP